MQPDIPGVQLSRELRTTIAHICCALAQGAAACKVTEFFHDLLGPINGLLDGVLILAATFQRQTASTQSLLHSAHFLPAHRSRAKKSVSITCAYQAGVSVYDFQYASSHGPASRSSNCNCSPSRISTSCSLKGSSFKPTASLMGLLLTGVWWSLECSEHLHFYVDTYAPGRGRYFQKRWLQNDMSVCEGRPLKTSCGPS